MGKRTIGPFTVEAIGLGAMNVSHGYRVPPPERGAPLLRRALELGVDHFDTASFYGDGRNETLVGAVLKPHRARITLASKGGMIVIDGVKVIDSRPASLKRDVEASLKRLQTDVIDLYYLHRWDKTVPIEDAVGGLADMVSAGKIRAIGLSEISAETLRRAHRTHPIAALQSEYSLWSRQVEDSVLPACRALGVALVAFSPLGRGFLTAVDLDPDQFADLDIRRGMPRFHAPNLQSNLALLQRFRALAAAWGVTPARLALSWLLHQSPEILPIPGTTQIAHLEENIASAGVTLTMAQCQELSALINPGTVSGPRYAAPAMREVDSDEARL